MALDTPPTERIRSSRWNQVDGEQWAHPAEASKIEGGQLPVLPITSTLRAVLEALAGQHAFRGWYPG